MVSSFNWINQITDVTHTNEDKVSIRRWIKPTCVIGYQVSYICVKINTVSSSFYFIKIHTLSSFSVKSHTWKVKICSYQDFEVNVMMVAAMWVWIIGCEVIWRDNTRGTQTSVKNVVGILLKRCACDAICQENTRGTFSVMVVVRMLLKCNACDVINPKRPKKVVSIVI